MGVGQKTMTTHDGQYVARGEAPKTWINGDSAIRAIQLGTMCPRSTRAGCEDFSLSFFLMVTNNMFESTVQGRRELVHKWYRAGIQDPCPWRNVISSRDILSAKTSWGEQTRRLVKKCSHFCMLRPVYIRTRKKKSILMRGMNVSGNLVVSFLCTPGFV